MCVFVWNEVTVAASKCNVTFSIFSLLDTKQDVQVLISLNLKKLK